MVVRRPADQSQSGRYGAEPTPVCDCCHIYMTRQSIRGQGTTHPVSWICMICGEMKLDEKKFEIVREKVNKNG